MKTYWWQVQAYQAKGESQLIKPHKLDFVPVDCVLNELIKTMKGALG